MLDFLIHNIFVEFGGLVFYRTVRIPVGANYAQLVAYLFLCSYENEFIHGILRHTEIRSFNFTFLNIDDRH